MSRFAERFHIIFSEAGGKVVTRVITSIRNESLAADTALGFMKRTLLGITAGASLSGLASMADEITRIRNRLSLTSETAEEVNKKFQQLGKISISTRSSLASTGDVYTRMALAVRNLGVEQDDAMLVTKAMNQAVVLSGANAREAEAGLLQFSQGLASGRLAGDELRAVLEQLPAVADVIGKELGVTRGALRALAREGEITPEVIIRAFRKAAPSLEQSFGKTVPTLSQSLIILQDKFKLVLDEINQKTGIFERVSRSIIKLSDEIETFARIVLAGVLVVSISAAAASLKMLLISIVSNPWTALATAVLSVASLIVVFADRIELSRNSMGKLSDLFSVVIDDLMIFSRVAFLAIQKFFQPFLEYFGETEISVESVLRLLGKFGDVLVGVGQGIQSVFMNLPNLVRETMTKLSNYYIEKISLMSQAVLHFGDIFSITFDETVKFVIKRISRLSSIAGTLHDIMTKNVNPKEAMQLIAKLGGEVSSAMTDSMFADLGDSISSALKKVSKDSRFAKDLRNIFRADVKFALETGRDWGTVFMNGFMKGYEKKNFQQYIDSLLSRANNRAQKSFEDEVARMMVANNPSFRKLSKPEPKLKDLRTIELEKFMSQLEAEASIMRLGTRERRVQLDLLRAEQALREKQVVLNDNERLAVEMLIRRKEGLEAGARSIQQFADVLPKTKQGFRDLGLVQEIYISQIESLVMAYGSGVISAEDLNTQLDSLEKSLSLQADIYQRIKDPAQKYQEIMEAIAQVTILARTETEKNNLVQEKNRALLDSLSTDKSFKAGFQKGILEMREEIFDFSKLSQKLLEDSFHGAEQALTDFVMTGKAGIRDLAQSITRDLVQMGIRRFITAPLFGAMFGGPDTAGMGGIFGSLFGGGKASGGWVAPGTTYLVGEQGPELLRMGQQSGQIVPAGKSRNSGGSVVNVTMNVQSRDADSFRRTADQSMGMVARAARRRVR